MELEPWAEMSARLMAVVRLLEERHPDCLSVTDAFSEDENLDGERIPAGASARIYVAPWRPELDDDDLNPELCLWLFEDGWQASIYDEADESDIGEPQNFSDIEVPMEFAVDADASQVAAYLVEVLEGRIHLEP